ncbi:MAG: Bifunctional protein HldE [Verrucomicrobiae bacterium]|nr:Bifunctional protein HldE [Verrucomicrobiae bacterium]
MIARKSKEASENPTPVKLLSLSQARRWAAAARRRGERVVATNGCFDLLHYGHVSYLQRARQLGDQLIVGLNADASIRQLKGPDRPLMPARQRAAVLAALACVDAIVIFREKRATRFLAAVRPAIYVKGGDYRVTTLPPEELAVLGAATVKILPFVRGFSTTALVEKIRRAGCD